MQAHAQVQAQPQFAPRSPSHDVCGAAAVKRAAHRAGPGQKQVGTQPSHTTVSSAYLRCLVIHKHIAVYSTSCHNRFGDTESRISICTSIGISATGQPSQAKPSVTSRRALHSECDPDDEVFLTSSYKPRGLPPTCAQFDLHSPKTRRSESKEVDCCGLGAATKAASWTRRRRWQ